MGIDAVKRLRKHHVLNKVQHLHNFETKSLHVHATGNIKSC